MVDQDAPENTTNIQESVSDPKTDLNDSLVEGFSPGKALKEAREKAGVSLSTIVNQTAIPQHKLELLEDDQFDALGAEIFVIGYLKKYASLLKLPEDELISDFKAYTSALRDKEDELAIDKTPHKMKRSEPMGASSISSKAFIYKDTPQKAFYKKLWFWFLLLCVLAVWLAYEIFLGSRSITNSADENDSTTLLPPVILSDPNTTGVKSGLHTIDSVSGINEVSKDIPVEQKMSQLDASDKFDSTEHSQLSEASESLETNVDVSPEFVENGSVVDALVLDVPTSSVSVSGGADIVEKESASSISDVIQTNEEQDLSAIDSGKNAVIQGEDAIDASSSTGSYRLDMDFNDDCWVEVKDASGTVLIAKLRLRGDNLRLFGEAPFEVMVGNSRAVQIHLNGRLVDVPVNPNRRTARFTVDMPSDDI